MDIPDPPRPVNCRCRIIDRQITDAIWDFKPQTRMRRTAEVDPDLIRNAEIRALTDPS